jgi:hypothetical protein
LFLLRHIAIYYVRPERPNAGGERGKRISGLAAPPFTGTTFSSVKILISRPFYLTLKPIYMACNFSIPFSGSADTVLARAKSAVQSQGGAFNGNNEQGNFQVTVFGNTIKGSYSVKGQDLNINIDSKPFLLPCSAIEGFLKQQVGA